MELADRCTLARMLRLERAATASVAAVLYRSIHVSVMRAYMSRRHVNLRLFLKSIPVKVGLKSDTSSRDALYTAPCSTSAEY